MNELAIDRNNGHDLDDRTVRALTECMTVIPEGGDVYTVVGENGGGGYRVDVRDGRCTCPDARHNLDADTACKHERRVRFATGVTSIPAWADDDGVDDLLGAHVADSPVYTATDGGATTDDGRTDDRDDCWCSNRSLPCFEHYECDSDAR